MQPITTVIDASCLICTETCNAHATELTFVVSRSCRMNWSGRVVRWELQLGPIISIWLETNARPKVPLWLCSYMSFSLACSSLNICWSSTCFCLRLVMRTRNSLKRQRSRASADLKTAITLPTILIIRVSGRVMQSQWAVHVTGAAGHSSYSAIVELTRMCRVK